MGYVLLLVLLINYLVVYDPGLQHVHNRRSFCSDEPGFKPNPIDAKLLAWARGIILRLLRLAPGSWSASLTSLDLSAAISKVILNLCDVQIVTGLAILVSGFMVMDCGISSYHWQIMVYLAWFSTVAHMSSLTSVQDYLSTRPWQRNIRFLITLALLAMLITALVPTAYFQWSADLSMYRRGHLSKPELQALPAACFLQPTSASQIWESQYCLTSDPLCMFRSTFVDNGPFQSAVFSIFLLLFTFVSRTVKLFAPLSTLARRCLTRPISRLLHCILLSLSHRWKVPHPDVTLFAPEIAQARVARPPSLRQKLLFRLVTQPILALLLMLRLQVDIFSSMLSEVRKLLFTLLFPPIP